MAIQPSQPQGVGAVLDTAFQLYKTSFGAVWPLCLLLWLVSSPPNLYLLINAGQAAPVGDLAEAYAMLGVMGNPIYWAVSIASLALVMWVIGALYLKQNAVGVDADLSVGAALQSSFGRILALVLMAVLFGVAICVGFILFLVPGLILMVSLMFGTNLIMLEGKGPVSALTGSHKLVWGNWWRCAAVLTVGGIMVMIIYMAAGLIITVIMPFIRLGGADLLMSSLVSAMLIGVLVNLLVTPFFSALLLALYWDLKLRKEGGDLAARVGALNVA